MGTLNCFSFLPPYHLLIIKDTKEPTFFKKNHHFHFSTTSCKRKKRKDLPVKFDPFLFSGYSQGCGVSWLPGSPSCLNRKNTLGLADDAHKRVPQHQIFPTQSPDNHRETRERNSRRGDTLISSQADYRQTHRRPETRRYPFRLKAFTALGKIQSSPPSLFE